MSTASVWTFVIFRKTVELSEFERET